MSKVIGTFILFSLIQTSTLSGQAFVLKKVDMANLTKLVENDSLGMGFNYHYLLSNYGIAHPMDSVQYNTDSSKTPCAYHQLFKYGINYFIDFCGEKPTMTETISFPKTDLKKLQEFVEIIKFTEGNTWVKPTYYGPSANEWNGCETFIIQTETRSILRTNCGC